MTLGASAPLAAGDLVLQGVLGFGMVQAGPGRVWVHRGRAAPALGVRAGVLCLALQQPQRLLRMGALGASARGVRTALERKQP